jgi:hypothetical protein
MGHYSKHNQLGGTMNNPLFQMDLTSFTEIKPQLQLDALSALEQGRVVYLPKMAFLLRKDEEVLLNQEILASGEKNVSFDARIQRLRGIHDPQLHFKMEFMMGRYAQFARSLVEQLFPQYQTSLSWGRTSYRPVEVEGRVTSKRKDDTRLHVDAFPSTPVNGQRILRVFSNINPHGMPRTWDLGEPFPQVLSRFYQRLPRYSPLKARVLKWIKATREFRSSYDHYMLALHDAMKLDENYQQTLEKFQVDFPARSTWIVFTDQVSHAALRGQFLLEQTFYLPVSAMEMPELSPLKQWENCLSSCKIAVH